MLWARLDTVRTGSSAAIRYRYVAASSPVGQAFSEAYHASAEPWWPGYGRSRGCGVDMSTP
ncbi:MAG TPA: hypothetical protein VJ418_09430, partial [Streptosporangiaceae bacterium]|nr:hypothetical protein [Streptosporangiaceae bacterium]